jgi:hypothetical protein
VSAAPTAAPGVARGVTAPRPPRSRSTAGLRRLPLLLPAGIALLAGLDSALLLLGLPAPLRTERLPDVHGILMVIGFVGTLVSLERAVALGRWYGYAAPLLSGLGALALLTPAPLAIGRWMLVAGTGALVLLYLPLWRRQRDDAVLVQTLGAASALAAMLLWAGGTTVPSLLPWLVGFVVLTIGGERLELARLAMGPGAGPSLVALSCALLGSVAASLLWPVLGSALLGLALLGLTAWLLVHDVARRTVRSTGLTRYMAVCMLAGYFWLAVAAAVWTVGGPATEGGSYDAVVHAVFLGFTVSMVMAHAPVILPAVLRRPLPYRPVLYLPVLGLHATLVLRLLVGDAYGLELAWQVGGVGNIVSLLLFAVLAAWSSIRGTERKSR